MKKNVIIVSIMLFALSFFLSCAKESEAPMEESVSRFRSSKVNERVDAEQSPSSPSSMVGGVNDEVAQDQDDRFADKSMVKNYGDTGLWGHFLVPMETAKGRLLEYNVNVTYECENILLSRKSLLELISKYAMIRSSSASTETSDPYVNTEIFVKVESLYDVLSEMEEIGILKSENIRVRDHTENMVLSERKVRRENIRIIRRGKARNNVSTKSKNWREIENQLENSEDKLDAAEHRKWQIRDKVSWAKINISLRGPERPDRIDVPLFRNAFIGLVNLFLDILYALIWLAPFIAVFILFWKYRNAIKGIFKRKNKPGEPTENS